MCSILIKTKYCQKIIPRNWLFEIAERFKRGVETFSLVFKQMFFSETVRHPGEGTTFNRTNSRDYYFDYIIVPWRNDLTSLYCMYFEGRKFRG